MHVMHIRIIYSLSFCFTEYAPANCSTNLTVGNGVSQLFITPSVKNCISCTLDMNEMVWTWRVELPSKQLNAAVGPMTASYAILYEPSAYVLPGALGVRQVICTGVHSASTLEATLVSPCKFLRLSMSTSLENMYAQLWCHMIPCIQQIFEIILLGKSPHFT